MKTQKLLKQAKIEVIAEQDDSPVRGYFDSGEPDRDRELENEILARLDRGDVWAWACVKVIATVEHNDVQYRGESNWLCGCSYENEADFREPGCYFDDMRKEALEALALQLSKRPLDPVDVKIRTTAQQEAIADLVNRALMYRSAEVEGIRQKLLQIFKVT